MSKNNKLISIKYQDQELSIELTQIIKFGCYIVCTIQNATIAV